MANRPLVIAFDVIETLFPLEPVRQRFINAGQPSEWNGTVRAVR